MDNNQNININTNLEKKKSELAKTSMILGIVSISLSFIPLINCICFVTGLLAIIFAIISFRKKVSISKAVTGIILGSLSLIISLIYIIIIYNIFNPVVSKPRKPNVYTQGIALIESAKTAYQAEQLKGKSAIFSSEDSVCFDLEYLADTGYFNKSSSNNYTGSVLVDYNYDTYEYSFWISNGEYVFGQYNGAGISENDDIDLDDENIVYSGSYASNNCGNKTGVIYCITSGCYKR